MSGGYYQSFLPRNLFYLVLLEQKMAGLGISNLQLMPIISLKSVRFQKPVNCISLQQQAIQADERIECEPCAGRGWLLCDFCKGQKTNIKSETNRIYRRCPSCKAVGYLLCTKCKVYKCVTYPDQSDGQF